MNDIQFVLPAVSHADMAVDQQGALLVNQAAAVIVAAWLQYKIAEVQARSQVILASGSNASSNLATLSGSFVGQNDLSALINNVQDQLKVF